jgi:outer membrane protein insertion porin family
MGSMNWTGGGWSISKPAARIVAWAAGLAVGVGVVGVAWGQASGGAGVDVPPAGVEVVDERLDVLQSRPVREVVLTGVLAGDEALVRNQLRVLAGQPLDPVAVREDVRRLARLGRFDRVEAQVRLQDDASVIVTYVCQAAPVIQDVQAAGNREIPDNELAAVVGLSSGVPANQFLLDSAKRRIIELYQKRGFYQADVTIDTRELAERGIVVFRIREGDPLKVTRVEFAGNANLSEDTLIESTLSREWTLIDLSPSGVAVAPPLRLNEVVRSATLREPRQRQGRKGYVNDQDLTTDVASLEGTYANAGFLRARVDREIIVAPNGREAVVRFVIDEGPRFTVRGVRVVKDDPSADGSDRPTSIISPEQAAGLISLRAGEALTTDGITKAAFALRDAYQQMGYVDTQVRAFTRQIVGTNEADVLLMVTESPRAMTGLVSVKGNDLTQSKVVRRLVRVKPDRPLDGVALRDTERRLTESQLFDRNAVRVTTQREDPANPGYRDVLVEVAETNTGSLTFGASASSDGGVVGQISLTQRNFDIADTPDSFDELFRGQAFRGAGQTFNITVAPGSETQSYLLSLSEPALFETDWSGSGTVGYRSRIYRKFDEGRGLGVFGVGRRFGDRWQGSASLRIEDVQIDNIDADAATDVFAVQGSNTITGLSVGLSRRELDRNIRPTRGNSFRIGVQRVGILGGDYNFTNIGVEGALYVPIDEEALGRRTVLLLRSSASYIPEGKDEVPIYERLYLGGRDFRGFRFQGIGPRGVRNDNPALRTTESVGGTFSFFAGAQIEKPLVEDFVSGVIFIDSGLIADEITLSPYRAAVGVGLRLYIPALGPVPLAFDFGVPIKRENFDERRLFSFSLDLPF